MHQPKITVIVPVYNAASYLEACIESLLDQSFKDFEVILINDGSSDDSPSICERYRDADERIRVINKPNGGVSSARNQGLKAVRGEWVAFVDADDTVGTEYLKSLYDSIGEEEENLLVVQGIEERWVEKDFCQVLDYPNKDFYTHDNLHKIFSVGTLRLTSYSVAKLFNNKIIENNHLRFHKDIQYAEDAIFVLSYLCCVNHVRYVAGCEYHYMIRETPQNLTQKINSFEAEKRMIDERKHLASRIAEIHGLDDAGVASLREILAQHSFQRMIMSLYLKRTRRPFGERRNILKTFTREEIEFLKKYHKPTTKAHKITRRLLTGRFYLLCDLYLNLIAMLRDKRIA